MALPTSYLITTKNVESFFNALVSAQAPERFTQKFLENLELKSSNDRLFLRVVKFLKFIDDAGAPTQRYFDFLDQTQSRHVLAEAIKEAYSDLFNIRKDAQNLSIEEVKNKFKTLTQGQKPERVITMMANTFKSLCDYADWSQSSLPKIQKKEVETTEQPKSRAEEPSKNQLHMPSLNYNIQIHLPETRDSGVYDAIFKSLKEHLLR